MYNRVPFKSKGGVIMAGLAEYAQNMRRLPDQTPIGKAQASAIQETYRKLDFEEAIRVNDKIDEIREAIELFAHENGRSTRGLGKETLLEVLGALGIFLARNESLKKEE